ncbi:site-specific integrase [Micromonospora sp. NPDC005172]|uniref:site-specific integrase n=1 Tax=Micromonospora sp. NPDC005172 TaxID=3156867 RepID=UPI00339FFA4E
MGRNANGEGSIYRRKDGRYEAAAYFVTTKGLRKRVRIYGRTREEVHAKLNEAKLRAQQGIPVPDRNWQLGDWLDYWLAEVVQSSRRPTTYERYELVVRLYLKPGLGTQPLSRLSVPMVQTFLNQQLAAGRSLRNVQIIREVLSAALTRACREELLVRNVARLVELAKWERPDIQPWTSDEARRFMEAARDDPLCLAFNLLLLYGLRRGEVLGLRWCDVDQADKVLRIRQQLQRVAGELRRGPLKTKAGRRDLPLLDMTHSLLVAQRLHQQACKEAAGDGWLGGDPEQQLVTSTRSGLPIEPRNLRRSFRRICEQQGIRVIRLHDLRHTTATLLKDLGVPARDAQLILGHSSIAVTQEIYQHDSLESRREALEGVERMFLRDTNSAVAVNYCRQTYFPITSLCSSSLAGETGLEPATPGFGAQKLPFEAGRLTSVRSYVEGRLKQWLLGLVAVSVAVKIEPPAGENR